MEESILQQEKEAKRKELEKIQLQTDCQKAQDQLSQDQQEQNIGREQVDILKAQFETMHDLAHTLKANHEQMNADFTVWSEEHQQIQTDLQQAQAEYQVLHVKVDHAEKARHDLLLRLEKLKEEQASIDIDKLQLAFYQTDKVYQQLLVEEQRNTDQLQQIKLEAALLRDQLTTTEQLLHKAQDALHETKSDHASQVAAQQAALHGTQQAQAIEQWQDKQRLVDILEVAPDWQIACETVLGEDVRAYVLEDMEELWPHVVQCSQNGNSVITLNKTQPVASDYPRLADKMKGSIPHTMYPLASIYAARNLDEARSWLPNIKDHESIVTQDGVWLGVGWIRFKKQAENEQSMLARAQKITELSEKLTMQQTEMDSLQQQRDQIQQLSQQAQQKLDDMQRQVSEVHETMKHQAVDHSKKEQELAHAKSRIAQFESELIDINESLTEHILSIEQWSQSLTTLKRKLETLQQQQEDYIAEKSRKQQQLEQVRKDKEEAQASLHQKEMEYDRQSTKLRQLETNIDREQERLQALTERLECLCLQMAESEHPDKDNKLILTAKLEARTQIEQQLNQHKDHLNQASQDLDSVEKEINIQEAGLKALSEQINQLRMQEQELVVRADSIQETLDEFPLKAEEVLAKLPEEVSQSLREEELIKLSERIKRLGAINLAAIEEFAIEKERKDYLDNQHADLEEALSTLESAIEKMDHETRIRLENTFDEVNTSFKSLFPRLFGGGRAELELTCDNLLEAGIIVMAQPPGKKNSTIHLLSGGEKAMTAVALVFAIFQLNPSPFCMLDEVDAPLDDVNVGRFCALVKEMSQMVQFLFITHNKVTMELADHLIGVTMREPGVSRLVAVDVKQALTTE